MVHPSIFVPGTYRKNNNKILNCISCSEGTYNPIEGSTNSTDCLNCTAGIVCIGMGLSVVNSSNPRLCPGGYFCGAGTGSVTSNSNPCPAGTYRIEGTKSLEEAEKNICQKGRYCPKGTSATITEQKYVITVQLVILVVLVQSDFIVLLELLL